MNQPRRLWAQMMARLFDELIGIHQRAHAAFGQKLGCTHAFPLFQGKRRNRTIVYNAEYGEDGSLKRGVFFIAGGSNTQLSPEQWSIGSGWSQWKPNIKQLTRLAGHVYDAVEDEWNLDLAPLKMPFKLVDWINGLATEFAQRSDLAPDHPVLLKCLRRVYVRGGHDTVSGEHYELPHEGLGGDLAAYVLAASRNRVDQRWNRVFAMPHSPVDVWSKAPQLWIDLTPDADRGIALGFPRPAHRAAASAGGIQLARYPHPDKGNTADNALRVVADLATPSLYEVTDSFSTPRNVGELAAWREVLHIVGQAGESGMKLWSLTQPDTLEATRQTIKNWDRSFSRWAKTLAKSA